MLAAKQERILAAGRALRRLADLSSWLRDYPEACAERGGRPPEDVRIRLPADPERIRVSLFPQGPCGRNFSEAVGRATCPPFKCTRLSPRERLDWRKRRRHERPRRPPAAISRAAPVPGPRTPKPVTCVSIPRQRRQNRLTGTTASRLGALPLRRWRTARSASAPPRGKPRPSSWNPESQPAARRRQRPFPNPALASHILAQTPPAR